MGSGLMSRHLLIAAAVMAALSLAGCGAQTEDTARTNGAPAPAPAPTEATPLTPSGPPAALSAEAASDEGLNWAASVTQVEWVAGDGAKLFGVAGGDPAMNGLYSYIGFYANPAEGWVVFKLGDFLDYTVLSSSPGRVDLDIHESTYDQASGQIGDRHRKAIVAWAVPADGATPASVTVTPAQ